MPDQANSKRSREDSPGVLVARFLRSNNYPETLSAFLSEAGLPLDTGSASPGVLTIERILEEKNIFDLSRNFEKTKVEEGDKGWSKPAPSIAMPLDKCGISSNILTIGVEDLSDGATPSVTSHADKIVDGLRMLVASADRRIHCLTDLGGDPAPQAFPVSANDSPTLCYQILDSTVFDRPYVVTGTMSGNVSIYNLSTGILVSERKDHQKYIVRMTTLADDSGIWIATAGWDSKVYLYRIHYDASKQTPPQLEAPRAKIVLPTNPQAIRFVWHEDLNAHVLVVSRRDSTFLYYYSVTLDSGSISSDPPVDLVQLGRQNLAPHSNAWIAFTPSSFEICPTDPSLLAVATSHTPHMKVILVRLLLPKIRSSHDAVADNDSLPSALANLTQASQARAEIAIQDREDAAILIQCNTLAPQSQYSTPELTWRPDGTGVWVNGDDGVVRGIETSTGKIITALKGAHDPGTKIRCLWAGLVNVTGKPEEWIISGGFDRRLVIWKQEHST